MDELDQILAEANAELEAEQAQSAGTADFLSGLGSKALQGATYGFGDEATAYVNSGIDKARAGVMGLFSDDVMPPKSYDQYLAENRRNMRMAGEASPVIATGLEVAGSIASPNPLGKLKGATTLGKMGVGALGGATNAGLYAFGSGEGGATERLVNALDDTAYGAGIGGALPVAGKVLQATGKFAKQAGVSDQLRALGLTKTDLKKAGTVIGENIPEGEESNLLRSFKSLRDKGEFDLMGGSLEPNTLVRKFSTENIPKTTEALDDVLSLADRRTGKKSFVPIPPQMSRSYDYVKTAKDIDRSRLEDTMYKGEIAQVLNDLKTNTPGKLKDLQQKKQYLHSKNYPLDANPTGRSLDKEIAKDLKEQIERIVDSLADKGRIGYKHKGSVQKLNREIGDYSAMKNALKRQTAGSALGSSIQDKVLNLIRTTGGSGSAIIALAVSGAANPLLAAVTLAAMQNPRLRFEGGKLIEKSGKGISWAGSKLKNPDTSANLVRILEALKQGE